MIGKARKASGLLKLNPFIDPQDAAKLFRKDLSIDAITANSTLCRPGSLFVATTGATKKSKDGHDFIDDAIANGASLIVVNRGYMAKRQVSVPIIPSTDSKSALCHLLETFHDFPSSKLKIIGITGTNGKTSASFMLHSILQRAGSNPKIMGTLGMGDPNNLQALPLTTMHAEFISASLANMVESDVTHVIMEISSHALALKRVEAIKFAAVALTNITEDHLDFHESFAAYRDAKARLFFQLANKDAIRVLPSEHPFGDVQGILFGEDSTCHTSFANVRLNPLGLNFRLKIDNETRDISLPMFGFFQVPNACLAATLARKLGLDWVHI
ncbi:MAG TPA: Mur ligase family protein, partial [Myxococcota bacterium]|nr:Mur ligase family protein [Myxococcota bacterium]